MNSFCSCHQSLLKTHDQNCFVQLCEADRMKAEGRTPAVCSWVSSVPLSGSRSLTSTSSTLINSILQQHSGFSVCLRRGSNPETINSRTHHCVSRVTHDRVFYLRSVDTSIIVNNSQHSSHITTGKRFQ